MLQSLFYLTTVLHVSGVTITHLQDHKTTVTTASGKRCMVLLSAAIVEDLELILVCCGWRDHAIHNTLKLVSTLLREQQTTIRCNGYQMLQLQLFCAPEDW
jgi:hypothetical protein